MENKTNIPKLRFPDFNEEWEKKKIEDIAPLQRGFDLTNSKIEEGVFPVVFSNGVLKTHKEYKAKAPGVVMGRSGTLGKITFVEENYWPHNTSLWVTDFKGNSPKFIYYIYCKFDFSSVNSGSTVPTLNRNDVHSKSEYIPTLPEQQKIASFLSAVDKKIEQLQKKKEMLEQYKKGMMQKLFSQQLRFKDDNGNDFLEWEEKELGEIGSVVGGLTYSPEDISKEGVLVLRSSNIQNRRISFDDNVYVQIKGGTYNPVKENDILICVRNGSKNLIGKNAIIKKENEGLAFGAFMSVYRSKFNLYIYHYFDTEKYKKEIEKNLGATINSINGSELKKFKIPFPSLEEQTKIADFLTGIDTKIDVIAKELKGVKSFKKGLLQQMFV